MKPLAPIVALIALLGMLFAPAVARKPQGSPDPGPEEERMAQMLGMMDQLEAR
jgi:hypothetical protein